MNVAPSLLAILLSWLISLPVLAADRAIWECRTSNPNAKPIVHLVEWGDRSYVKFAHLRFGAHYEPGEEHQGWYWHNDGNGFYRYAIVLEEDNRAWFHEFDVSNDSAESNPLDYFLCSQIEG